MLFHPFVIAANSTPLPVEAEGALQSELQKALVEKEASWSSGESDDENTTSSQTTTSSSQTSAPPQKPSASIPLHHHQEKDKTVLASSAGATAPAAASKHHVLTSPSPLHVLSTSSFSFSFRLCFPCVEAGADADSYWSSALVMGGPAAETDR